MENEHAGFVVGCGKGARGKKFVTRAFFAKKLEYAHIFPLPQV
jgi:hypothetical protein